jgi:hypothetical protein
MESADRTGLSFELGADAGCNLTRSNSALACPFHVGHINSTMREILPGIFRTRFRAHVVAGADEVAQLSPIAINERRQIESRRVLERAGRIEQDSNRSYVHQGSLCGWTVG